MYTDGYGLNFYTNEYGYYDYCENKDAIATYVKAAAVLGVVGPVFGCVCITFFVYKFM